MFVVEKMLIGIIVVVLRTVDGFRVGQTETGFAIASRGKYESCNWNSVAHLNSELRSLEL